MAIRLVLVRHGLSSFNAKGLIQGRTDDSFLTDNGYDQASRTGKVLSKINFDKIYSSPLSSCLLYTSPSPRDATLSRMPSSA